MSFLVIGECVADIVRAPAGSGAPDRVHPGGSPANVAYGLGRLGRDVTLLTQLAEDPTGRLIADHLKGAGVRVEIGGVPARTPSAVVGLDAHGQAAYTFDITWTLEAGPAPLDPGFTPGITPAHVHIGSIAAVTEPGSTAVLAVTERLRAGATVSYDPNVRPDLMGDHTDAVRRVERCVALADLVKASDEDLAWLYPGRARTRSPPAGSPSAPPSSWSPGAPPGRSPSPGGRRSPRTRRGSPSWTRSARATPSCPPSSTPSPGRTGQPSADSAQRTSRGCCGGPARRRP